MAEKKQLLKKMDMPKSKKQQEEEKASTELKFEESESITPTKEYKEGTESLKKAFGTPKSRPEQYQIMLERAAKAASDFWGRPIAETVTEKTTNIQNRNKPRKDK